MYYERSIGNIPAQEFWNAIEKIIANNVEFCFLKYLPTLTSYIEAVSVNDDIVSTAETCKKLKFTRQTLNNWFNREPTKSLLKSTLIKRGNKNFYKIAELKTIIDNNEEHFSKNRYRNYVAVSKGTDTIKLNPITEKILDKEVSGLTAFEVLQKVKKNLPLTIAEEKIFEKMRF